MTWSLAVTLLQNLNFEASKTTEFFASKKHERQKRKGEKNEDWRAIVLYSKLSVKNVKWKAFKKTIVINCMQLLLIFL